MSTIIHLIRHGSFDGIGHQLVGRAPGIALNARGRAEAVATAGLLAGRPIAAIATSPVERARETAVRIGERIGLAPVIDPAFAEIDFGGWTGRWIEDLEPDPHWQRFNRFRSSTAPPGGEAMLAVQARMVAGMIALADAHADAELVVIGHGDPIKTALAHFLGLPLDLMLRLEIGPASVSTLALDAWGARILAVNRPSPAD